MILVLLTGLSCDRKDPIVTNPIIGMWERETVYLNGVNSAQYVDFLNNETNFLQIKPDKTFMRAYDNGVWNMSDKVLTLDRDEKTGMMDWHYKIVDRACNSLTLEMKLTEGQYCCDFDSFAKDEVITITEVYKRTN